MSAERSLTVVQPLPVAVRDRALTEAEWSERAALMRQTMLKGANAAEVDVYIAVCKRLDFDPVLRYVDLIDHQVYINHKGLLHLAHRSGQFNGIEILEQGETQTHYTARVAVRRKDMDFPFVYPGRYPKGKRNAQYGDEMAITRAECMALRRAFDVSLPVKEEINWGEREGAVEAGYSATVEGCTPEGRSGDAQGAGGQLEAGVSDAGEGAQDFSDDLDWTDFWSWAKARGLNDRAALDEAAGRATAGMVPAHIARAIVKREAETLRPRESAPSPQEQAWKILTWLGQRQRSEGQEMEWTTKLFALTENQDALDTLRAKVTPLVHQDTVDLCWFDRMTELGRTQPQQAELEPVGEEPVEGEYRSDGGPGDDVPFK